MTSAVHPALARVRTLDDEVRTLKHALAGAHAEAREARAAATRAQHERDEARALLEQTRATLASQATAHLRHLEEARATHEQLRAEVAHLRRALARR